MNEVRLRIRLISIFFLLVGAVLLGRLFFLQVVHADEFRNLGDRQYARPTSSYFNRGSIFFRDKNDKLISAATLKTTFFAAINPRLLENAEGTYSTISAIVDIPHDEYILKANKVDDPYEVIVKDLSEAQSKNITDLGIKGLTVFRERARSYPAGSLAAHVLGFVGEGGVGAPGLSGKYGIEKKFEGILAREPEGKLVNFFAELFAGVSGAIKKSEIGDVVLTIEPSVQAELEKELADVTSKWRAKRAAGIIIDPNTGAIRAMGATPSFDPGNYFKTENVANFSNPLVESVFEMGSIIKPLTMSAGIDSGAVTATSTYHDYGSVIVNNAKLNNSDPKANGVVDMQTILAKSLNTGAVFVEQKMGNDTFRKYMLSFGLGEKSGIDLPGEVSGLVKNLSSTRDIEYATASFGQGIALTPIQVVRALSAIANGGVLIRPHVVESVIRSNGEIETTPVENAGRVISEKSSRAVTDMLTKAVDFSLANGKAKLADYSIAAKTGTAQISNNNGGGYSEDRFLHTFFGYFPATKPQYLIFLLLEEPKGVNYSSETLTTPFSKLVKYLIHYYEVEPDRAESSTQIKP